MSDAQHGVPAPPPPVPSKGPDPLIGRVINERYKVTSVIARGGMGKVYRAEQAPLGREVALKVLHPSYHGDNDPEFHKRFFLEASICAKLTHPNTVTIFDYGRTDDDIYYIAMELLEGRTLHRCLRDEGFLPADRALHIARQVCRSLREAHNQGVIHRDLKPANIFLVRHGDENDFAKVLDFGLVKDIAEGSEELTQTGLFMGSPKYMSPEQIRGEKVDGRCDIYALGVILYEMLCGKVPFDRPNSVNILMAHVHEAAPSMSSINPGLAISPELERVVAKAMAKQASERFASMDEFLVALKHVSDISGTRSAESSMSGEFAGLYTGAYPVAISGEPSSGQQTFTPSGGYATGPTGNLSSTSWESPLAPAEPKRSGSPKLLAALLIGFAAIAGGAFALLGGKDAPPAPQASAPAPPPVVAPEPPAVEPEPEPTPAEAPRAVQVLLRSEPAGADVTVGDATYGPTPAEVQWLGEDAAPGREVTFLFELEGYRDYTVTRSVYDEEMTVSVELVKIEEAVRRPRVRRVRTEPSSRSGSQLEGYKNVPY